MKLSDFELDVMTHFWERGETISTEVIDLVMMEKGVAANTVRTIIFRLEEKGAIRRVRQDGKALVYKPMVSQESMSSTLLPSFLKRLFGNSPEKLISKVIEEGQLDKKDVKKLKRILNEYDKTL